MTELGRLLARRIRESGPLSVAQYMEAAGAAYYATRDPFGAAGDFVTAPEVSQIFGELIGAWCAELWQRLGAPDPLLLVELGPGRGSLMADALRAARIVPKFASALCPHLVEQSPVLRAEQAAKLGAFAPSWHDGIATLPPGPMLLIANEFLDALPIRQFERRATGWHERRIGLRADGEDLTFVLDREPSAAGAAFGAAEDGAIAELGEAAAALAGEVGARLAAEGGAALFIDYGYSGSARGDTLQAVRRHRYCAVLAEPGEADITAHVDFAALAAAARGAGAEIFGPVAQGAFLERLGLRVRERALLAKATPAQAESIRSGCRRLSAAGEMGDLFKVLALTQPGAPAPAGFE